MSLYLAQEPRSVQEDKMEAPTRPKGRARRDGIGAQERGGKCRARQRGQSSRKSSKVDVEGRAKGAWIARTAGLS
jgi:hypothetical protein